MNTVAGRESLITLLDPLRCGPAQNPRLSGASGCTTGILRCGNCSFNNRGEWEGPSLVLLFSVGATSPPRPLLTGRDRTPAPTQTNASGDTSMTATPCSTLRHMDVPTFNLHWQRAPSPCSPSPSTLTSARKATSPTKPIYHLGS